MSIDGETLEQWRRVTEVALAGPWVHVDGQVASVREDGVAMFIEATGGPTDPEAAFIALAREAMPALLAEVEWLRAETARLGASLTEALADALPTPAPA